MELVHQTLPDGKIIPRLKSSKYDPHGIDGRTSEAAAKVVGRYELIFIGAQRIRELNKGSAPLIKRVNGNNTTALLEIEQGLIDRDEYLIKVGTPPTKRHK